MLKKIVGSIWRNIPQLFRLKIIRSVQNKFTVSVAAVVFDDQNRILVLDHVLRPFSNWGLPGGFINVDEQPKSAIEREILEETGLILIDVKLFRLRTIGRHLEILYTARSTGQASVKSREINDLGWFAANDLPAGMSEAQKIVVQNALDGVFSE